jgi:uncharacterized protein YkwD
MNVLRHELTGLPVVPARQNPGVFVCRVSVSSIVLSGFFLAALLCSAQESAVNMQHISTAGEWMKNPNLAKRKAAYLTFHVMDVSAQKYYKSALDAAQKFHQGSISRLDGSKNSLNEHAELAKRLNEERGRMLQLIRTDYHKDEKKVKMLRDEMKDLMSLHEKVVKLAKKDLTSDLAATDAAIDALCEIAREREKFNSSEFTKKLSDKELRASIISDSLEAERVKKTIASLEKSRKEIADLAEVEKHNAANGSWCSSSMKSFATLCNYERVAVGLRPLFVEEKLSSAAEGHSSDMASKGFFAHESPVPNKKTPWDRANLAKFDGQASGENIFMGSANYQAAYNGWFGSDGHRFGMFADGLNCTGIGISGVHWTMMIGSKNGWQ